MANIEVTHFTGQNWVITPAALAVNEAPPANIHGQKWLLVLSGVAVLNFQGQRVEGGHAIPHQTLHINPEILGPCHFAITHHDIPRPPGTENRQYFVQFQVEQWAPFIGISGFSDEDSDFAICEITRWWPSPFKSGFDAFSSQPVPINNIFDGILADFAMVDEDTDFKLVSYKITLLGKIVFTKVIIT